MIESVGDEGVVRSMSWGENQMGHDKSEFCMSCGNTMPKIFRAAHFKLMDEHRDLENRHIKLQEELIMVRKALARRRKRAEGD